MGLYKLWLENRLDQEESKKLKEVWRQALQALGIDGLKDQDALSTSLTDIEYGKRHKHPPINGAIAALKLLHNSQVFQKIGSVSPDLKGQAGHAEEWLNKISSDGKAGGSTVGDLFQELFGKERFNQISGDDTPDLGDDVKAEVPPQPPKPESGVDQGMQEPFDDYNPTDEMPPETNLPDSATGQPPIQQQKRQLPQPPMGAQQGLF